MPSPFPDLPAEQALAAMPAFLAAYIVEPAARERVRAGVAAVQTTPDEFADLLAMIGSLGDEYGRRPCHPLAQKVAKAYIAGLVGPGSTLAGLEHLQGPGPRMIVANHLGYADTLALRELLIRAGREDLGDRVAAVAGPKVYEDPLRLFAVASHPSIRVMQSSQIDEDADPRALVRITRRCLADCTSMLDEGLLVVLFGEGTRSRSARLQPFIKAVSRWVAQPGLTVVPLGHWGSEGLYAVDGDRLGPSDVHARIGPPIAVDELMAGGMGRHEVLAAVHEAVEGLLPPAYRSEGPRLR